MSDCDRSLRGGGGEQADERDEGNAASARRALETGRTAMVRSDARAGVENLYRAADLASPEAPALATSALLLLVAPSLASRRHHDAKAAVVGARAHLPLVAGDDRALLEAVAEGAAAALELTLGSSARLEPVAATASQRPSPLWDETDATALISTVAVSLVHQERTDTALELLRPLVEQWRSRGESGVLSLALATMAMAERRAGRPARALRLATEARDLAAAAGRHRAWLFAHVELANAHSVAGDAERCRAAATVVLTDPSAAPLHRTSARSAMASVELWSGDPCAVVDLLEPLVLGRTPDPAIALFHQTLAAAYVQLGRAQDAEPLRQALMDACPDAPGRLRGAALTCDALLSDAHDRDERFRAAIDACGDQAVLRACAQLQYARRLVADGCEGEAAAVLSTLAADDDENVLGLARSARRDLARLWLERRTPDAAWLDRARAELRPIPSTPPPSSGPRVEVRLHGGLEVRVDDRPLAVPAGATSVLLAALAVRRSGHVEELADLLWPDTEPDVARRRLRNVVARLRGVHAHLVVRRGERLTLGPDVVVDEDVVEERSRVVLAMPAGPDRARAAAEILRSERGPFLPEARYEEWADEARFRAEARRAELEAIAEAG